MASGVLVVGVWARVGSELRAHVYVVRVSFLWSLAGVRRSNEALSHLCSLLYDLADFKGRFRSLRNGHLLGCDIQIRTVKRAI